MHTNTFENAIHLRIIFYAMQMSTLRSKRMFASSKPLPKLLSITDNCFVFAKAKKNLLVGARPPSGANNKSIIRNKESIIVIGNTIAKLFFVISVVFVAKSLKIHRDGQQVSARRADGDVTAIGGTSR